MRFIKGIGSCQTPEPYLDNLYNAAAVICGIDRISTSDYNIPSYKDEDGESSPWQKFQRAGDGERPVWSDG